MTTKYENPSFSVEHGLKVGDDISIDGRDAQITSIKKVARDPNGVFPRYFIIEAGIYERGYDL